MRKILAVAGFFVFVFVFFLGVSIGDYVYAVELEPIAAMGGITWMENGIKEGHKSFVLIGLKANLKVANDSYVSLMAKGWQMSEPLDEDREIPRKGYGLSSEFNHSIKLEKVKFTPYAGFGFEHWSRAEGNSKIANSWTSVRFFTLSIGTRAEYKRFYAKAGAILPFDINTNSTGLGSKLGYKAEIGADIWKKLNVGLFREQINFKSDTSLALTGVKFTYRF